MGDGFGSALARRRRASWWSVRAGSGRQVERSTCRRRGSDGRSRASGARLTAKGEDRGRPAGRSDRGPWRMCCSRAHRDATAERADTVVVFARGRSAGESVPASTGPCRTVGRRGGWLVRRGGRPSTASARWSTSAPGRQRRGPRSPPGTAPDRPSSSAPAGAKRQIERGACSRRPIARTAAAGWGCAGSPARGRRGSLRRAAGATVCAGVVVRFTPARARPGDGPAPSLPTSTRSGRAALRILAARPRQRRPPGRSSAAYRRRAAPGRSTCPAASRRGSGGRSSCCVTPPAGFSTRLGATLAASGGLAGRRRAAGRLLRGNRPPLPDADAERRCAEQTARRSPTAVAAALPAVAGAGEVERQGRRGPRIRLPRTPAWVGVRA